MEFTDLIGYAATAVGISIMLPQTYKTYKTKSAEDLSWAMLALFVLNNILWFTYGLLLFSPPLLLANGVGLVILCTLSFLKYRYRNNP